MATIRINRTSEYINRGRNYNIFIDGEKVGTISDGETKDFPSTAGQHIVSAKIDWCSSPALSIDVKEDKIINLKIGGFKYGKILMPIGLTLIIFHFILSISIGFTYTTFAIAPLLLLLFYYVTLGRKKYLTLEKVNEI